MASKVFFAPLEEKAAPDKIERRLKDLLDAANFEKFIPEKDYVAVKTHFGEGHSREKVVPPYFFKYLSGRIKKAGAVPFFTETSTLYKGGRSDAVSHITLAQDHGYTLEATGMPIIMADGLKGDYEHEVKITDKLKVAVAGLLKRINAIVAVSHPTGHIALGFGGTLKNLGMGLSSRKGKLAQHSSLRPQVDQAKCKGCGHCHKWCPADAITLKDKKAHIDEKLCLGCGECLVECGFDAILFDWEMDTITIQESVAEHALGVVKDKQCFFINYSLNFTKDCDCMPQAKKNIVTDLGLFASSDPVAVDEAVITMIEERGGKPMDQLAYESIDPRVQTKHGERIGLGTRSYELVRC